MKGSVSRILTAYLGGLGSGVAWVGLLVLIGLCAAPMVEASEPQFQVNSYTPSEQRFPQIDAFDDGGFIVTWTSRLFPEGNTTANVIARRFDASLAPIGDDFLVAGSETETTGHRVATQPDGGFLVVWTYRYSEPTRSEVWSRLYSSTGAPAGPGSMLRADRGVAQVESDDQGRFTLLLGSLEGWHLQRLDAAGTPLGEESFVYNPPFVEGVDLATRGDGRSMVFWGDTAYRYRRYNADGTPASVPTVAPIEGAGKAEIVATDEGYYLLGSPNISDLAGQRIDPIGHVLGSEFSTPALGGGGVLEGFAHHPETGYAFVRQTFGPVGDPFGGVEQGRISPQEEVLNLLHVNTYTFHEQGDPAITALSDGTFLVVWHSTFSDTGDPNWSIQARRIRDDIFADGFESGDTSAWSIPTP